MFKYTIEIWKFRDIEGLPEFSVLEFEAKSPEQLDLRLKRMKDLLLSSGCDAVEFKILEEVNK